MVLLQLTPMSDLVVRQTVLPSTGREVNVPIPESCDFKEDSAQFHGPKEGRNSRYLVLVQSSQGCGFDDAFLTNYRIQGCTVFIFSKTT